MTNKLIVPNVELVLNQMKNEIAAELGIQYGAETSSRDNGRIGAEMTKRLVEIGKQQLLSDQGINPATITNDIHNKVTSRSSQLH